MNEDYIRKVLEKGGFSDQQITALLTAWYNLQAEKFRAQNRLIYQITMGVMIGLLGFVLGLDVATFLNHHH
jgi:hypothetical protein